MRVCRAGWGSRGGLLRGSLRSYHSTIRRTLPKIRGEEPIQHHGAGPGATVPSQLDHQTLAQRQEIYSLSEYSPGSPMFLSSGASILNRLVDFLRAQYDHYGFEEVITPLLFKKSLWEKSGHWEQYKDDMFMLGCDHRHGEQHEAYNEIGTAPSANEDSDSFGLKPMNCPGHCLLYSLKPRSYRELPLRFAEFSPLHRNEPSGSLTGLTRVRRFHQDDAHIFCRPDQIAIEVQTTTDFLLKTYEVFHLPKPSFALSTRPLGDGAFIGSEQEWDSAEMALRDVLNRAVGVQHYEVHEGEGAFYGPKIDVILRDRAGKAHQTGTIQLDMQLPQRFDLRYTNEEAGRQVSEAVSRPVIIHRAIFGSVERFMALLSEHYQNHWPLWLSPNPIIVIPTTLKSPALQVYARHVKATLQLDPLYDDPMADSASISAMCQRRQQPIRIDVDLSDGSLASKIAQARSKVYNLQVVIGERDMGQNEVTLDFSDQHFGFGGPQGGRLSPMLREFGEQMEITKAGRRQIRIKLNQLQSLVRNLLSNKL